METLKLVGYCVMIVAMGCSAVASLVTVALTIVRVVARFA